MKQNDSMAYAIMGKYPPGGRFIVYASPRREPLQKILDNSPELGSIEEKNFGFDISGIDKFYSVNIRIMPEYEQSRGTKPQDADHQHAQVPLDVFHPVQEGVNLEA